MTDAAVPPPVFIRLNKDWSAEPNAPHPEATMSGSVLALRFFLSPWAYPAKQWQHSILTFENCRTWRLGPTNDEGWYRGQCRYSRLAPRWGEFYEICGPDDLSGLPDDWITADAPGDGARHFLFYFRDETFECFASNWTYAKGRA